MASIINVTPTQPVTLNNTAANVRQNLWEAVDIAAFDILDLELVITTITGAGLGAVQVDLITGMQVQSEDGWIVATPTGGVWGALAPGAYLKTFDKGLLRYVRWQMTTDIPLANTVPFYIKGMARRYGTP